MQARHVVVEVKVEAGVDLDLFDKSNSFVKGDHGDYLASADYLKFLRAEEAKLRPALIDLGLAK